MLLQTNSYVVPKERRAEHQRLLRRFRQTLARLGCEHFEVYEQVGPNWTTGENTGRYVQIMRFRDRRHQLSVQSAERADPGAQAVIAEFCNLINFPYQQQQGLFAVGFYQSALTVTTRREATRAEVEASDAAATGELEQDAEETAEAESADDEESAVSAAVEAGTEAEEAEADEQEVEAQAQFEAAPAADTKDVAEEDDRFEEPETEPAVAERAGGPAKPEATDEAEVDEAEETPVAEVHETEVAETEETVAPEADEPQFDEFEKAVVAESNAARIPETEETLAAEANDPEFDELEIALAAASHAAGIHEAEEASPVESVPEAHDGPDDAEFAESFDLNEADHAPAGEVAHLSGQSIAGIATHEKDGALGIPETAGAVDEKPFGDEEVEAFSTAEPAMAFHAEELPAEVDVPAPADASGELDATAAEHAAKPAVRASEPEWAGDSEAELAFNAGAETIEPELESTVDDEAPDQAEHAEAVELSAEEGDFEIVYEQLPGASGETTDEEAGEGDSDEDGGFDALLSNEQLLQGFDAEDELLQGAAHKAELHAHGAAGGRNGNDTHSETSNGRHGRMR